MALAHGNEGIVKVATATVAEVQNFSYDEEDVSIAQKSSMGDSAEVSYPSGCKRGSGSIECLLDDADTTGQDLLVPGASVALKLYTEGATAGDLEWAGTVVIATRSMKVDKNGDEVISFTFQGVLTKGVVAS